MNEAGSLDHAKLALRDGDEIPTVVLSLDEGRGGLSTFELLLAFESSEPSIRPDNSALDQGELIFNPQCLGSEGPAAIGRLLRMLLSS